MDGTNTTAAIAVIRNADELHAEHMATVDAGESLMLEHNGMMYYVREHGGRLMLVVSDAGARQCYGAQDEHGAADCDGPDPRHVHCVSHDGNETFETVYCTDCRMLAVEAGFIVTG